MSIVELLPIEYQLPVHELDSQHNTIAARGNGYGEAYIQQTGDRKQALLMEGTLYTVNTLIQKEQTANIAGGAQVPGTGIVLGSAAAVAFNDAGTAGHSAALAFANILTATQKGTRPRLERVKLTCTLAPVGATNLQFAWVLDGSGRYGAGTTSFEPISLGYNGKNASYLKMIAMAASAVAATLSGPTPTRKILDWDFLKTVAPVVGDQFIFDFTPEAKPSALSIAGTTATRYIIPCSPFLIEPATSAFLHLWGAGQTAAGQWAASAEFSDR